MADFLFLEQLNKIMRQVPRPRLMYKKGIGAKGFFKPYMTLKRNMEEGDFPSFELFVQIVDYKFISHPNYLKRTVCWNDNINPPVKVGILKLTDVIKEHGESGDSDCFAPGNIIPGISLCEDEFSKVMDYAHKIGGIERGAYL